MPVWAWVLIGIGVIVLVAVVAVGLASRRRRMRTESLQERFGPEYERTVAAHEGKGEAEAELEQRVERRRRLDVKPLAPPERDRYAAAWRDVQARFVDAPQAAVSEADALIADVMRDRGYPVDDFEQRASDVSVDHPLVVENYRSAHKIAVRSDANEASTEDLRRAMQHYRALFDELLDATADEPLARERAHADETESAPTHTDEREVSR